MPVSKPWDVLKHYDCEHEPSTSILFSTACALFWYAADYHEGQDSALYSLLSTSDYKPGASERSVQPETVDADIYQMLVSGDLDATELSAWFNEEWPKAKAREDS